jgi:hypothetical protein
MYLAFKVIHLLGVVLFLGNIIVTAVWKTLADRTRGRALSPMRSGWLRSRLSARPAMY